MPTKKLTKHRQEKLNKIVQEANIQDLEVSEAIAKITHPKKKAFLACYYATNGNATKSAKAAMISRRTFYTWLETDSDFKYLIDNQLQELLDQASDKLISRALTKDQATAELIFFLKTRHPDYKPVKETIGIQNTNGVKLILTRG